MRETPKPDAPGTPGKPAAPQTRAERLAVALKANMGRRKAQAKARAGDVPNDKTKG